MNWNSIYYFRWWHSENICPTKYVRRTRATTLIKLYVTLGLNCKSSHICKGLLRTLEKQLFLFLSVSKLKYWLIWRLLLFCLLPKKSFYFKLVQHITQRKIFNKSIRYHVLRVFKLSFFINFGELSKNCFKFTENLKSDFLARVKRCNLSFVQTIMIIVGNQCYGINNWLSW